MTFDLCEMAARWRLLWDLKNETITIFQSAVSGSRFQLPNFFILLSESTPQELSNKPKTLPKIPCQVGEMPIGQQIRKNWFPTKVGIFCPTFYGFSKGTYKHIIDDKKVWPQSLREARRPYWNLPYIRGKFWAHALSAQWSCPAGNQLWMDEPYP